MERKKEVEDKSIWFKYFRSIRHVCPWSYQSYLEGRIKIIPFDRELMELTEANWAQQPWDALVYMVDELIKESKNKLSGFYLNNYKKLAETINVLEEKNQNDIEKRRKVV